VKVKIDENLPVSVAAHLRELGMDAHTVHEEELAGTTDPDLLDVMRLEDRMIITLDRGFGDIRRYPPGTHPGVVVLRLTDESAPAAREAVAQLVENHDLDDLRGAITVVQQGTLRIRRPPETKAVEP
jgi:predicted nuclease of predicted toxin-antitoxin system